MSSKLEKDFDLFWLAVRGPKLTPEHRFHPTRRWRFDRAHPVALVAIELEGGIWTGGRHTRGSGYVGDCEKYNAATLENWAVFRFTRSNLFTSELDRVARFIELRQKIFEENCGR